VCAHVGGYYVVTFSRVLLRRVPPDQRRVCKHCSSAFSVTFPVAFLHSLPVVGSVHWWSALLSAPQLWWWQSCTAPLLLYVSPDERKQYKEYMGLGLPPILCNRCTVTRTCVNLVLGHR